MVCDHCGRDKDCEPTRGDGSMFNKFARYLCRECKAVDDGKLSPEAAEVKNVALEALRAHGAKSKVTAEDLSFSKIKSQLDQLSDEAVAALMVKTAEEASDTLITLFEGVAHATEDSSEKTRTQLFKSFLEIFGMWPLTEETFDRGFEILHRVVLAHELKDLGL